MIHFRLPKKEKNTHDDQEERYIQQSIRMKNDKISKLMNWLIKDAPYKTDCLRKEKSYETWKK